ncbi:MAG: DHH family phosphoesterase [archaeon GB-1867-035]|nr:DHH family phosphoesterase [Candidatus Culexmicrobium profundum]
MGESIRNHLRRAEGILVVHHWDADGIASAAIIAEKYGEVINYCPPIGLFKVNETVLDELKNKIMTKKDLILILDWNIPYKDVETIEKALGVKVAVIDHHYKSKHPPKATYYNPVAYGESEEKWPSTTWTIMKTLNIQLNLKVILGVFGDLEEKAVNLKLYHQAIKPYMERQKYSVKELIEAAKHLNACGRIGDRRMVENAVWKLIEYGNSLKDVLSDEEWWRAKAKIEAEVNRIISSGVEAIYGNIILKRFKSPYNLTSEVARKLSKLNPQSIIVALNENSRLNEAEIYVRRGSKLKVKLTPIINKLVERGLEAGGKEAVFGLKVPHNKLEEALKLTLNMLMEELKID